MLIKKILNAFCSSNYVVKLLLNENKPILRKY